MPVAAASELPRAVASLCEPLHGAWKKARLSVDTDGSFRLSATFSLLYRDACDPVQWQPEPVPTEPSARARGGGGWPGGHRAAERWNPPSRVEFTLRCASVRPVLCGLWPGPRGRRTPYDCK